MSRRSPGASSPSAAAHDENGSAMSIVVAAPTQGTAVNPTAPSAVAVLDANPALAGLDPGSLIEGTVVGRDSRGQILLQTEYGQVSFSSRLALPVGSTVVLQLQAAGARLTAVVLSVDGQPIGNLARLLPPPQGALAPPPGAPVPAASIGGAPRLAASEAPAAEIVLSTGQIVTATLLAPAAPRSPSAAAAAAAPMGAPPSPAARAASSAVPAGSLLSLRVIAIAPPGAEAAPVAVALLEAAPLRDEAAPPPAPGAVPAPAAQAAQPPAPSSSAPIVEGQVVGSGANGQVLLRTPLGVIELPLASAPPTGSLIEFALLAPPRLPDASAAPHSAEPAPALALAQDWPALRAALATLAPGLAVAEDSAAGPLAPRVGAQLGTALLAFAAALESGDPASWLGAEAAASPASPGSGDAAATAARLAGDFARVAQFASPSGPGDWRGFFIPVLDGGALAQLRLYVRRHDKEKGAEKETERGKPAAAARGRRFVVELELSRLGALQLDGFLKGKSLSVILRSRQPLAPALRDALAATFAEANEAAGLGGSLSFQDSLAQFPVSPLESLRGKAAATLV
jgi:hypothetical protein